jgi:D-alanyl-D-alanine endopeptidase (penicillin-binding protein 7)
VSPLIKKWVLVLAFGMLPAWVVLPAVGANQPVLRSQNVLVLDQDSGQVLYGKNAQSIVPIASITKLMTAMVTLDANLDLNEQVTVSQADVDLLKGTHSRLRVGAVLTRDDLLKLALMASENRAASALARSYPTGLDGFMLAMNHKARELGMTGTFFADPTGLTRANVSTADDLAKLVYAAHAYPVIRDYSTATSHQVRIGGRPTQFRNTNRLTMNSGWDIGVSKTGFINEAGRCLVMQAKLAGRAVIIVLLDSAGKYTRIADATRIRKWLEVVSGVSVASSTRASGPTRSAVSVRSTRKAATHVKVRRGSSVTSTVAKQGRGRDA